MFMRFWNGFLRYGDGFNGFSEEKVERGDLGRLEM